MFYVLNYSNYYNLGYFSNVTSKLQVTSAKLQVPGKKQVVDVSIKQNSTKY